MRLTLKIAIACFSVLSLTSCGSSSALPEPELTMSFEELQSEYVQKVGAAGCVAFFAGDYQNAAHWFRIIEAVVPEWEGYSAGVLAEGKNFDAQRCY
jgi:hypothetical protein